MGTWGTGISSNDTYADVYAEFFDLYNEGKEVYEITESVKKRNQEILEMPDGVNDFWFALAKAQWECKQLQPEVFEHVSAIVRSGSDLKVWADLGATNSDIAKRRKVLDNFLQLLQTERPKAKRRKKKLIREPIFKKGDCLTFKLTNSNYGGAIILEAEYGTEPGLNLVAVTRINQLEKPSVRDIEGAEVLVANFAKVDDKPEIFWLYNYKSREVKEFVEVVGTIPVDRQFLTTEEKYKFPFTSGWKSVLLDRSKWQFESEKVKPKPERAVLVKQLTQISFWRRISSMF